MAAGSAQERTDGKDGGGAQRRAEDRSEDRSDDRSDPGPGGVSLRRQITNAPNLVTMARIALVPFVLLLIDNYNPLRTFLASLLYMLAAGTDWLDGYLARKRNQVSTLGKFLDPLADKLIVMAVLVTLVAQGRAQAWVVVILIGRDLAISGLRSIASVQGLVIAASDGGKIKTALQLVATMMLLVHFQYPLVGAESLLGRSVPVDYHRVGTLTLNLSMVVSVLSAVQYVRNFFSAALRPSRPAP